ARPFAAARESNSARLSPRRDCRRERQRPARGPGSGRRHRRWPSRRKRRLRTRAFSTAPSPEHVADAAIASYSRIRILPRSVAASREFVQQHTDKAGFQFLSLRQWLLRQRFSTVARLHERWGVSAIPARRHLRSKSFAASIIAPAGGVA